MDVAAVLAERPDLQPSDEFYVEFAMTGAITAGLPTIDRYAVASFLQTILTRPPLSTSPIYAPHRAILGSMMLELQAFSLVEASDVDLREASLVRREEEAIHTFREWAALARAQAKQDYHDHVTSLLEHPE